MESGPDLGLGRICDAQMDAEIEASWVDGDGLLAVAGSDGGGPWGERRCGRRGAGGYGR